MSANILDPNKTRLHLIRILSHLSFVNSIGVLIEDVHIKTANGILFEEVRESILFSAIQLRSIDDGVLRMMGDKFCGTLYDDLMGDGGEKRLSVREACNKIIHNQMFGFERDCEGRLNYDIGLHGNYGKRAWKAIIFMPHFVAHGMDFCDQLAGRAAATK